MNDKFTNNQEREEAIARKLNEIAEQTQANRQFAAELEEKLRSAHQPKTGLFMIARQPKTGWLMTFSQISPTLRWVALMVLLAVVLSWSIKTLVPSPQPAAENTPVSPNVTPIPDDIQNPTPTPEGESFDFRGAKLYMSAALPESPAQANVYNLTEPQPATVEYARSLANQFGIDGEVYLTTESNTGGTAYMVTDGKQQLVVNAENNFSYTSDMVASSRNFNGFKNDNAEDSVREFLTSRGFDFNFRLDTNSIFGDYVLEQVSPDGVPMQYEYFSQPVMRVTFNEDGSILTLNASLMKYDAAPLGAYEIISADEAIQKVLDDTLPAGKIESVHGAGDPQAIPPQDWYHEYPDNETVTTYGNLISNEAADPAKPAIIFIGNVPLTGNISGMESLEEYAFIQVTGQFIVENGIRKFNVESWDQNIQQAYITGSAYREGENIIVTNEDGSGDAYILVDPPADLPLDFTFPDSQLSSNGVIIDDKFYWTSLQFLADASNMGGGGGGGGMGFYALNLSGTPVPFPTPLPKGTSYTAQELAGFLKYIVQEGDTLETIAAAYNVSVEDLISANRMMDTNVVPGWALTIPGVPGPTRLDEERGIVMIQVYEKPDGSQRTQYNFLSETDAAYYELTGDNLEALKEVVNRPIKIWGNLSFNENGMSILDVERFEPIYPGLEFEVLTGTQEAKVVDGMEIVLFTTDGTTYIQLVTTGGYPDSNYQGDAGEVNVEVLRIPDETYMGYPGIRVFSSGPAINPVTGEPFEIRRVGDTVDDVLPDPYGDEDHFVAPDIIIDNVELIYYVSNPMYQTEDNPEARQQYIQPAWHFQGHYSNGDVLDIMIQALKEEYLVPVVAPNLTPG